MKRAILNCWLSCIALIHGISSVFGAPASVPLPPDAELRSFEFADKMLTAELVAAEPDIVSPVAISWDPDGRLFVAEMRDYPNATNGGTIRVLQDRDHDGRYETSLVFADGLRFPNSVLPWNGGVLVTAAPDLLFLKDSDGDGRADERRVLFTGFGTGNQQLRANGLTWGIDGWVYGANGRSDGNIHRPGQTNTHSLRGRDFRFRPGTGEFETLAGRSQFGLALDAWGNRFLSWNTIPIRHEVFPDRYLARNANLPASEILVDLLPAGDTGQVFPLTPPPLVFNNESSSHFNALAGLAIYRGDRLGPAYRGNAFVGETLRNLVHRRVLKADGVTFLAERGEDGTEFLRSNDPWFHPVNFATGPDGALYVVDFYRQFVEHPDFVPREMRDKVSWQSGSEHGRIWRIFRKDQRPRQSRTVIGFAGARTRVLLKHLESANTWLRETAYHLLLERDDLSAVGALQTLTHKAKLAETRILALHALNDLARLNDLILMQSFKDSHSRVREQAVLLSELSLGAVLPESRLVEAALALARDSDERVRLRAALAMGNLNDEKRRETELGRVLAEATNHWIRLAAISGSRTMTKDQIAAMLPKRSESFRPAPQPAASTADRQKIVEQFTPALKLAGDRVRGAVTFGKLCLACHYLQGQGQRVGPDLSGIASRPAEALLIDVLDPSRQVVPEFASYEIILKDGESVSGLFSSETETRITIRRAGSPDENIPRSQIQSIRATGKSLMPDGLEAGLSTQDMANLLAFLQRPDGALLPR